MRILTVSQKSTFSGYNVYIFGWMQNMRPIKLYENTESEKLVILELRAIEGFRNQGVKCENK